MTWSGRASCTATVQARVKPAGADLYAACRGLGAVCRARPVTVRAESHVTRLFIFGLGYTGLAVADRVHKLGW